MNLIKKINIFLNNYFCTSIFFKKINIIIKLIKLNSNKIQYNVYNVIIILFLFSIFTYLLKYLYNDMVNLDKIIFFLILILIFYHILVSIYHIIVDYIYEKDFIELYKIISFIILFRLLIFIL